MTKAALSLVIAGGIGLGAIGGVAFKSAEAKTVTKTVTVTVPGPTVTVPGPTVDVTPQSCVDAMQLMNQFGLLYTDAFNAYRQGDMASFQGDVQSLDGTEPQAQELIADERDCQSHP